MSDSEVKQATISPVKAFFKNDAVRDIIGISVASSILFATYKWMPMLFQHAFGLSSHVWNHKALFTCTASVIVASLLPKWDPNYIYYRSGLSSVGALSWLSDFMIVVAVFYTVFSFGYHLYVANMIEIKQW